jgi:hypothetical protein
MKSPGINTTVLILMSELWLQKFSIQRALHSSLRFVLDLLPSKTCVIEKSDAFI